MCVVRAWVRLAAAAARRRLAGNSRWPPDSLHRFSILMLSMFKEATEPAAAGSVTSTYNATVVRPASVHMEGCLAVEEGSEETVGWLSGGRRAGSLAVSKVSGEAVRERGNQWASGIGEGCEVLIEWAV